MSYKVFISYSSKDLAIVKQFEISLSQYPGIEVFVADYSIAPGSAFRDEIINEIDTSNLFVLLWSKNSKTSEWVSQEIGIAKTKQKPILPIVLHKRLKLPGFINDLEYLAAYKNPEESLRILQKNVFELAQKKMKGDALFGFILAGAFVWLLSQK